LNLYFLVEGRRTEKKVYRSWVASVFPDLAFVDRPEDVTEGSVRIIAGYGYPQYLQEIDHVLEEISTVVVNRIDHLFVCIDAEERTFEERLQELESHIQRRNPTVRYTVVVQNCCIETWLLGNRRFVKKKPESQRLRELREFYDVRELDPEQMAAMESQQTRASFHEEYLKEVFRERGLSYSKKRPGPATEPHYLNELARRHQETGHLQSFGRLVAVWESMGAQFGSDQVQP
jgi:hypothetical protein